MFGLAAKPHGYPLRCWPDKTFRRFREHGDSLIDLFELHNILGLALKLSNIPSGRSRLCNACCKGNINSGFFTRRTVWQLQSLSTFLNYVKFKFWGFEIAKCSVRLQVEMAIIARQLEIKLLAMVESIRCSSASSSDGWKLSIHGLWAKCCCYYCPTRFFQNFRTTFTVSKKKCLKLWNARSLER